VIIISLEGPPASGKGAIARGLKDAYGMKPVSLGAFLRANKDTDPRCAAAMEYADRGEFAPDEIIIPITLEVLKRERDAGTARLVLDGCPRTLAQAEAIYDWAQDPANGVDKYVFLRLNLPDYEPYERRRKRIEQTLARGEELRGDDKDDATFENRMAVYHEHTGDLRDFFGGKGILREIDAMGTEEAVFARVQDVLTREGVSPAPKSGAPQNGINPPPRMNGPE
jgi:adenylate kinase